MTAPGREGTDALGALDRLYKKKVITLAEAQEAARLISGDPSFIFPVPQPPLPAAAPPAPAQAPPEG